ncbi:MAG: hypothetical protein NC299_04285 [Lachnospiraceae bacterium]|nr:hypothetical protein [Ruminococcus sp.]MCM1274566.1 hypothetical protein [Lachnospiraceae bacterium]
MKKSFFKDYFLYGLRGMRNIAAASAVMSLFSTTFVGAALICFVNLMNKIAAAGDDNAAETLRQQCVGIGLAALVLACIGIAVTAIMVALTPAESFKLFGKKDCADTLGSLPLTYGQRFWGDFLSGLCAHMISFIPCALVGLILAAIANAGISGATLGVYFSGEEHFIYEIIHNKPVELYLAYILLLFMGYLGIYAISCLVTVCCGRTGSARLYSLIAQLLPSGLVLVYCYCAFLDQCGIEPGFELEKALGAVPGLGMWLSAFLRLMFGYAYEEMVRGFKYMFFPGGKPVFLLTELAVIALLAVGAYFLGKLRKNERTGRDFVFKGPYTVLSVSAAVLVLGLATMINGDEFVLSLGAYYAGSYIAIFTAFVVYAVIEMIHMRSLKRIWETVLKFIAICLAFQGFYLLTYNTGGFGARDYVPPRALVSEVRISGQEFIERHGLDDRYFTYRSDEAVSTILSEHRKMLDNETDIFTGYDLTITYVMKDGSETLRTYGFWRNENRELASEEFAEACETIRRLVPTDTIALGFIDEPRYDSIGISYRAMSFGSLGTVDSPPRYVTEGMEEELMELLKYDMINSYSGSSNIIGELHIDHSLNGGGDWEQIFVYDTYAGTLEFLNDPAKTAGEPPEREYRYVFRLDWGTLAGDYEAGADKTVPSMTVTVSTDDESAEARELMGYMKYISDLPEEEVSVNIEIFKNDYNDGALCVAEKDEDAVIRAMLRFARARMN